VRYIENGETSPVLEAMYRWYADAAEKYPADGEGLRWPEADDPNADDGLGGG